MGALSHSAQEAVAPGDWREEVAAVADDDERVWGISRPFLIAALVVPFVGALAVAGTELHRPLFRWVTSEDGPLEWSQFLVDVAAVAGAALVTITLRRQGSRGSAVLWGLFALGMLFIAGEEISWGQRVLGHETPEELRRLNHQEETNVHNIRPIQDTINAGFMMMGAYGSLGALALRRWTRQRPRPAWFDLFVPPHALFSLFFLVFGYKMARLIFFPSPRFLVVKYGEYIELCIAVGLAAFAWLTVRRLRLAPDEDPSEARSEARSEAGVTASG